MVGGEKQVERLWFPRVLSLPSIRDPFENSVPEIFHWQRGLLVASLVDPATLLSASSISASPKPGDCARLNIGRSIHQFNISVRVSSTVEISRLSDRPVSPVSRSKSRSNRPIGGEGRREEI